MLIYGAPGQAGWVSRARTVEFRPNTTDAGILLQCQKISSLFTVTSRKDWLVITYRKYHQPQ
jgi:hypothetical protein